MKLRATVLVKRETVKYQLFKARHFSLIGKSFVFALTHGTDLALQDRFD
jgi:hypothetical protein